MADSNHSEKKLVGTVRNFFSNVSVALVEVSGTIKAGDTISIEGATTNFEQKIESMQIDRKDIKEATAGQAIGLKVRERVREGDQIYRL